MTNQQKSKKASKPKQHETARISYITTTMTGTLHTDYAQKVYKRHFRKLGGSIYNISILGRKMGASIIDDEAIIDLETQIEAALTGRINDMQNAIDEMKALAGNKLERLNFKYIAPRDYEYECSTQLHMLFVDVLEKLDELIICIDRMTLLRLKSTASQVQESYDWRRAIEGTTTSIVGVAMQFRASLDRLIQESNTKAKKKTPKHGELFEDKPPEPKGMDTTPIAVSA